MHNLSGFGIQAIKKKAAIEKAGSTSHTVDDVFMNNDAAVRSPSRFKTAIVNDHPLLGRDPESSGQNSVFGPKAIDPAISAAKEDLSLIIGRRRIDRRPGNVVPCFLTIVGVKGIHYVLILGGKVDVIPNGYWRRQPLGQHDTLL